MIDGDICNMTVKYSGKDFLQIGRKKDKEWCCSPVRVCMMNFLEIGDNAELAISDWSNKVI